MMGTEEGALECSGQFVRFWHELIKDFEGAISDNQEGVIIRWADRNFIFCNVLTFDDAGIDLDVLNKRLKFASEFLRKKKHPGMLLIFIELLTEESRLQLQVMMEKVGLMRGEIEFGMSGDLTTLEEPHHPDLKFVRLSTQEDLDLFGIINAHAHKIPPSEFTDNFKISKLWKDIGYVYIGYTNDKPVCCAGAFPVKKSLFLLGVATEPEYQKRGFGESITRKALYECKKASGFDRVTFQSSEVGRPVYERIGIKVACHVHTLMVQEQATI